MSFALPLDLSAVLVRRPELQQKRGTYEIVEVLLVELGSLLAFDMVSVAWTNIKRCRRTCIHPQAMIEDHVDLRGVPVGGINPLVLHVFFAIKHIIVIFIVIGHFRCLSGWGKTDVRLWRSFCGGGLHKPAMSLLHQGRPGG